MEPVTHILTGACLARTGLNRRAAYATLTMAIAAEMPDIDTVWALKGPVESFTHHRGITHTFVGLPVEAGVLVAAVWAWHRWQVRKGKGVDETSTTLAFAPSGAEAPVSSENSMAGLKPRPFKTEPVQKATSSTFNAAPVRWAVLYGFAVLGLLSHLLLDYTNNYGIRPFFPFNARWYAGSFVFIVDPLILLLLTVGLVAPALFGLINTEVGARRVPFRGRGWAQFALVAIVALWGLRAWEHQRAVELTMAQSIALPTDPGVPDGAPAQYVQPVRALASPDPLNPFAWTAVADLGEAYQLAEVDSRSGGWIADEALLPKPPRDAASLAAYRSPLGRAYFDWSPMPVVTAESLPDGGTWVTLRDPRFMGGWLRDHSNSALTGTVRVRADGSVAEQAMDGRKEVSKE